MTSKGILNKEFFTFGFVVIILIALISGGGFSNAVTSGMQLWIATIIPSMFPYFFISSLLSSLAITSKLSSKLSPLTIRLFNTNGSTGYALVMSIISGYPMGAKTVADLKTAGLISDSEAVRASVFCSTSSPLFMISSVGGIMFNNTRFGICLAIIHLSSAFILGFCYSFYKRKDAPLNNSLFNSVYTDNIFYNSVTSSINSALFVGGIITLFYVFTEVLIYLNLLQPLILLTEQITKNYALSKGFVLGIFESTKGLKQIASSGESLFSLPFARAICGFGGLSVILQSISFLKTAKIKTAPFYLGKILHAVLSSVLAIILNLFIY